jgi:hypothetical protein
MRILECQRCFEIVDDTEEKCRFCGCEWIEEWQNSYPHYPNDSNNIKKSEMMSFSAGITC